MSKLNFKETAVKILQCLLKLTFKRNGGGGLGYAGVLGGKKVQKKDGGLKIIGLQGFFPHFALSWLVDWVPVW